MRRAERYHFTAKSNNAKTGPIPVTTSTAETCPDACPLKGAGCYAEHGPLAWFWRRLTRDRQGLTLRQLCARIKALPEGTLWRHNQAGDLPGEGDRLDASRLALLVKANKGRRGFTYTHKPMTPAAARSTRAANKAGFTVNLSADTLAQADRLAGLRVAPVVVVLPEGQIENTWTPEGRKVVVCPAPTHGVTCERCKLCAWADRKVIIGFPAHGARRRKVSRIAEGGQ